MSTLHGAGGFHGTHVPIPLEPRPIRQTTRPTGFDWGTCTVDPDAIQRLAAAGILTVTPEVVDSKAILIVKRKPRPKKKRPARPAQPRQATFDVQGARVDYEAGMSTREVAAKYGVSKATISRQMSLAGVQMRGWKTRPEITKEQVLELYQGGMSCLAIGGLLGCTPHTARARLADAGIHEIGQGKRPPKAAT